MDPLYSSSTTTSAFAIFGIDRAGLQTIELAGVDGTTSGDYRLSLSILGDIDLSGTVDGVDTGLLNQAIGTVLGQPVILLRPI